MKNLFQLLFLFHLLIFVGCQTADELVAEVSPELPEVETPELPEADEGEETGDTDENPNDKNVSCSPFGPPLINQTNGLKGVVRVLRNGATGRTIQDYFTRKISKKVGTIIVSELLVDQIRFDRGFMTSDGKLHNDQGHDLLEWFGIKFKSRVILAEEDEPGLYEFMVVSDDGSHLKIGGKVVSDSPGVHPPRMICAAGEKRHRKFVKMKRGKSRRFILHYFQGPKYHIALMVFWRKVDRDTPPSKLCGDNWVTLSKVLASDEGWKPLKPENFILPKKVKHQCIVDNS